jgi:hypothetical protein
MEEENRREPPTMDKQLAVVDNCSQILSKNALAIKQ